MTYGFRLRGMTGYIIEADIPLPPVVMRKFAGGSGFQTMSAGLIALRHAVTLRIQS